MKTRIALAALFMCMLPLAAHADPFVVTGGQFNGTGPNLGATSINISGQNFSFHGFTANPTQLFNTNVFLGGATRPVGGTQFFSERNTVCFNGTCVSHDSPFDPDTVGANFSFSAGSFDFPQLGADGPSSFTFTVPFNMTGTVIAWPSGAPASTTLLVVGQGEMTFSYDTFFFNGQTRYEFRRVEANFADPTPEPATLLLLSTGLAGAFAARRRRGGKM